MAIKLKDGQYKCPFCDFKHKEYKVVDSHRDSDHVYVLVAMTVGDLSRLIQFIYTKEEQLLSETLVATLKRYLKPENQINKLKEDNN